MKLVRIKQILELIPVSKSTLWQWVKDGKFPSPTKLGSRCTVWKLEDVNEFIDQLSRH